MNGLRAQRLCFYVRGWRVFSCSLTHVKPVKVQMHVKITRRSASNADVLSACLYWRLRGGWLLEKLVSPY